MKQPLIFAHRGVKGTHPENTMIAFQEAVRVGAHGIELDVHLSNDGEVVVIHDETLERTTNGEGLVFNHSLAQLKQFDAGSFFAATFAGETIPSLREVLQWATQTSLLLNIELKNDMIHYPGLEQKVVDLVREYKLEERVIFSSFYHPSLKLLAALAPEIERAILYHEPLEDAIQTAREHEAAGLHPNFQLLTKEAVQAAQQAGFILRPYTINEPAHLQQMLDLGVDVIITDWPMRAFSLLTKSRAK